MKILLATDGSEYSFAAARKCCDMIALDDDSKIKIISIGAKIISTMQFEDEDGYLVIAQKAELNNAEAIVEDTENELRQALGERDVNIETKAAIGYEKEEILQEAENWEADLIVVGSQGKGIWKRMLLGSVSSAIVRHAKCSVMVVRANEEEINKHKSENE